MTASLFGTNFPDSNSLPNPGEEGYPYIFTETYYVAGISQSRSWLWDGVKWAAFETPLEVSEPGPIGPSGPTGPSGPPGYGFDGPEGPTGPSGPAGAEGRDGQKGATGPTGVPGEAYCRVVSEAPEYGTRGQLFIDETNQIWVMF